jgi:hypothetical protein
MAGRASRSDLLEGESVTDGQIILKLRELLLLRLQLFDMQNALDYCMNYLPRWISEVRRKIILEKVEKFKAEFDRLVELFHAYKIDLPNDREAWCLRLALHREKDTVKLIELKFNQQDLERLEKIISAMQEILESLHFYIPKEPKYWDLKCAVNFIEFVFFVKPSLSVDKRAQTTSEKTA